VTEPTTATGASSAVAEAQMQERLEALTDEQKGQLSKALFPDTHTEKVTVCGKDRTLRPLTIKYSRQLNVKLQGFQDKVAEGEDSSKVVDIDLLDTVLEAVNVLCTFYEWEDVLQKVADEDCELTELQGLLVQQVNLQDMNDFLLMPLRLLVVLMQMAEIEMFHLQSTFSGLHSANITSVPSTS
jgi:hypothetical protein